MPRLPDFDPDIRLTATVHPAEGPWIPCGILSNRSCGRAAGVIRADTRGPMTEILTESFCERCGTRYTFESARPRARLKGVKVLSRGLKNFVLSDDNSMDEAMAAARSDTDRELTAHQLDAFHKTFNFCMSCRQYTCPNCWNEAEARCLTCAPHLGHDVLPAPFPDLVTSSYLVADPVEEVAANGSNGSNGAVHDLIGEEAPATGVDTSDFAARLAALMAPPPLDEPTEAVDEPAETVAEAVVAAAAVDEIVPDVIEDVAVEAAVPVDEPAEAEPIAQVEVANDIPYQVEAAIVEAAEGPAAADVEPDRGGGAGRGCRDRRPSRGVECRRCRHGRRAGRGARQRQGCRPDRRPPPPVPRRAEPRRRAR